MRVFLAASVLALIAGPSSAGWQEDATAKRRAAGMFSSGGGGASSTPAAPAATGCTLPAVLPCEL